MNWSAISAVADLLGATAVIVSLAYLAFQVKDARRSFVAGAQQQLGGDFSSFLETIWSDEDVFYLWNAALNYPERLTDEQRTRFGMIMFSMFSHFSNVLELSRVEPEFLDRYGPIMDRMLAVPQIQGWWERQAHTYASDSHLRRHIDQRIAALRVSEG